MHLRWLLIRKDLSLPFNYLFSICPVCFCSSVLPLLSLSELVDFLCLAHHFASLFFLAVYKTSQWFLRNCNWHSKTYNESKTKQKITYNNLLWRIPISIVYNGYTTSIYFNSIHVSPKLFSLSPFVLLLHILHIWTLCAH